MNMVAFHQQKNSCSNANAENADMFGLVIYITNAQGRVNTKSMKRNQPTSKSPCRSICTLKFGTEICSGCGRTVEERLNWHTYNEQQKILINQRLENEKRPMFRGIRFFKNIIRWVLVK